MLGKTLQNWGTDWKLEGNIVRTRWEAGKYETPPPPQHKRKKSKAPWVHAWAFPLAAWKFSSQKTWSPFLAWASTPCKEHPTYSVLEHIWFLKYQLPGFSNISDLKNCRFWIYQNLTTIDSFHRRTGGYLTNSNSPTAKVERIRNRLLKLVASTLIIIYEVINKY